MIQNRGAYPVLIEKFFINPGIYWGRISTTAKDFCGQLKWNLLYLLPGRMKEATG